MEINFFEFYFTTRVHLRTAFGDVALNLEYICACDCEQPDLEVCIANKTD